MVGAPTRLARRGSPDGPPMPPWCAGVSERSVATTGREDAPVRSSPDRGRQSGRTSRCEMLARRTRSAGRQPVYSRAVLPHRASRRTRNQARGRAGRFARRSAGRVVRPAGRRRDARRQVISLCRNTLAAPFDAVRSREGRGGRRYSCGFTTDDPWRPADGSGADHPACRADGLSRVQTAATGNLWIDNARSATILGERDPRRGRGGCDDGPRDRTSGCREQPVSSQWEIRHEGGPRSGGRANADGCL